MSDGREQSYYEIALTNRQVMSIFVVLLLCLLTAFASGVWVGRDGGAGAVQTADAQVISSGVGDGEEPLGQMDFFGDSSGSDKSSATGGAGAADAPAATPPPAKEKPRARKAGKAGNSASNGAAPAKASPEPSKPASRQPAANKPTTDKGANPPAATGGRVSGESPPAPARQGTGSPPAAAAAPESAFFFIQVFSSNDEAQARSVVGRLRRGSYPALLSSAEIGDRMMYRVRIGPYTERDEAQKVAQRVQQEYKLSTWITR